MSDDPPRATCPKCGSTIESGGKGCPNCGRLIGSSGPETVVATCIGVPAGLIVNVILGYFAFFFVSSVPPNWVWTVLVIGLEAVFLGTLGFLGVRLVRRGQPALGFFLVSLVASAAIPTTACDLFYVASFAHHG